MAVQFPIILISNRDKLYVTSLSFPFEEGYYDSVFFDFTPNFFSNK